MEMCRKKQWLVSVLLGAIVLSDVLGNSSGCFQQEKAALLDFKATYHGNDSLKLRSWVNEAKSNCCDWERVIIIMENLHGPTIFYIFFQ